MTDEMPQPESKEAIDLQLAPRLKVMGYILFVFSLITWTYALFFESEDSSEFNVIESFEEEVEPLQVRYFNSYLIAVSLVSVGTACYVSALRKQRIQKK